MGEKDITERVLENFNDVFSDIINVLLFDGEDIVDEADLENAVARADYKEDNKTRELERDVAKFWEKGGVRFSVYGIENQTRPERDMPLRIIGYDGLSYRQQMNQADVFKAQRFPVVSLVLYYGRRHWNQPTKISELFATMDERLKPYFHDYGINLFEIAYLSEDTVAKFKSDFRYVADFFVQRRKTGNYIPMPGQVRHLSQLCRLLSVMTDDDSFEKAYLSMEEKGGKGMCDVVDKIKSVGREEGVAQGMAQGESNKEAEIMLNMYRSSFSLADIAKAVRKPIEAVAERLRAEGAVLEN